MNQFTNSIQKLIDIFVKFPTVGPRTAQRFIFYLIKLPEKEFNNFIKALSELKKNIKICSFCFNPFEEKTNESLCPICRDHSRNRKVLCLVERESDLLAIEKTKKYKGLYFILGGNVSSLKKENIEKLKIEELKRRIKNPSNFILNCPNFEEIIIATNLTSEGESTALLLERKLKENELIGKGLKITRLGRGLPIGGELEYADEDTLSSAFENRK